MASLQHIKKAHHEVILIGVRGYELRSADKSRFERFGNGAKVVIVDEAESVLGFEEVLVMRAVVAKGHR